jgi:nitrogen fixation/metabolism regulation signal transduction histidine kinase
MDEARNMRGNAIVKLPGPRLRTKLIAVFALVLLIPTVSLVFVSQFIIARSIDRWESVSQELIELLVLPIGDKVMEIASDPALIQVLEVGTDLSELEFTLSEDYIVAIYDASGKRLFSTIDDPILEERLLSLERA